MNDTNKFWHSKTRKYLPETYKQEKNVLLLLQNLNNLMKTFSVEYIVVKNKFANNSIKEKDSIQL